MRSRSHDAPGLAYDGKMNLLNGATDHSAGPFSGSGNLSQLVSIILMSSVSGNATELFPTVVATVRHCLDVAACQMWVVDVERAKHASAGDLAQRNGSGWASLAIEVATSGAPMRVDAGQAGPGMDENEGASDAETSQPRLGVPLKTVAGRCVGAVCIGGFNADGVGEQRRDSLELFARQIVHELELQALVVRNPITGLATQWALEQFASRAAARQSHPHVLLIGARINEYDQHCETLGRVEAERMLTAVGRCFEAATRGSDLVVRADGDMIVAACGMRNLGEARGCVRRMQSSLSKAGELTCHAVSLSLGVAELRQGNLVAALKDLEGATYAARRLGNNMVVTADHLRQALQLHEANKLTSPLAFLMNEQ